MTPSQLEEMTMRCIVEFERKYGDNIRSFLLLCKNENDEIMGCLGVEVTILKSLDGYLKKPMMENLAVGKQFRRKRVGSQLVKVAENMIHSLWGYNDCYCYVDKLNMPAVQFFNKLGYHVAWETDSYHTLKPTESGLLQWEPILLLCMKKELLGGLRSTLKKDKFYKVERLRKALAVLGGLCHFQWSKKHSNHLLSWMRRRVRQFLRPRTLGRP